MVQTNKREKPRIFADTAALKSLYQCSLTVRSLSYIRSLTQLSIKLH